jgi:hypothetical protein
MLKLSIHVETRIRQRGLQLAWIELTVGAPSKVAADKDPSLRQSFRAIPDHGGRILKVVHRPDGDDTFVVTAHFDRGARL